MSVADFHSRQPRGMPDLAPPLTPEVVRQQLLRLLKHPSFADSARSSQLLSYLVERVLQGDAGELKEYALAVDVFGRGSDFDPKLDSLVRTQASRLRTKLIKYYQGDGRDDPVRFEVPRRGYALKFSVHSPVSLVEMVLAKNSLPAEQSNRELRRWYWIAGGFVAAVAAVAIGIGSLRQPPWRERTLSLTRLTPEAPPIWNPWLSRDGKLLSYSVFREGGNMDIYVQHMATSEPAKILGPRFIFMQSLSPDGSHIVFSSFENGGGTYVVPVLGGLPRRLAPLGHLPSLSPDGKWLLYSRYPPDRRKVYVVSADGGEPRQLHPEFDLAQWAKWAPDGQTYFFSGRATSREEIDYWVSSLDGSRLVPIGLRRKLSSLGIAKASSWVAIMQWMKDSLYVETNDGDVQKIWRIRIDPRTWLLSGAPEQLTSFLAFQPEPTLADNGQFVIADLLVRYAEWIVPLDSGSGRIAGAIRRVTGDVAGNQAGILSGDGRHIVYATRSREDIRFWLKDLTSGAESIIHASPAPRRIRALSNDAKRLYYETNEASQPAVYRAGIPEGNGQSLCSGCCAPAISPDEKTMLSCPSKPTGGLVLRRLDTGAVTDLLPSGVSGRESFQFSPDGRWLAFHEMTDYFRSRIVVVPVRDSPILAAHWIVVADGLGVNRFPAWSVNGQLLYFRSNRDGSDCVWAQRLDVLTRRPTGPPFKVYDDGTLAFESSNLAIGGHTLLLRRATSTSGLWAAKIP